MKVLLVKPPNELGREHYSLFNIFCIAANMRKHGIEPRIINANTQPDWEERLYNVADGDTLVGISCMTAEVKGAIRASDIAKSKGSKVLWGGIHTRLFPFQVIEDQAVDYVATGEGEQVMVDFAKGYAPKEIPNLLVRDGSPYFTKQEYLNMDDLPFPAYDLLDSELSPWMNSKRYQYESSRGCYFKCSFCWIVALEQYDMRYRSPEIVAEHFKQIQDKGVKRIELVDDNPYISNNHMPKLCEELKRRGVDIPWNSNCRADFISRGRFDLQQLYDAGMHTISIGAESGSQKVLDYMHKGYKVRHLIDTAQAIAKVKGNDGILDSSFSFFFGTKDETVDDVRDTIKVFDEIKNIAPQIRIGVTIFTPYPESPLSKGLWEPPATLRDWLNSDFVEQFSGRFTGKPWHKNPEFYSKLCKYGGAIYSHAWKKGLSGLSRKIMHNNAKAWEWLHSV